MEGLGRGKGSWLGSWEVGKGGVGLCVVVLLLVLLFYDPLFAPVRRKKQKNPAKKGP